MQHNQALAKQHTVRQKLINLACATGLACAFIFVSFPNLDIAVSALFYHGQRTFLFDIWQIGPILRFLFQLFFTTLCIGVLISLYICTHSKNSVFNLTFPKWMFLTLCLIIGPGLVANTLLKDNWGRARPHYIQQFDGQQKFTPVMQVSDQCQRNCSFISGEAAMIFVGFFALALIFPLHAQNLIFYGILAGMASGAVRILQGGHFLSDVLFSGIIMALVVSALHWLVFVRYATTFAHKGPIHIQLNRVIRYTKARLQLLLKRKNPIRLRKLHSQHPNSPLSFQQKLESVSN
ncbi:MAG: phosphatase PAP2 family protein [Pseudomonadota bacterium]